METSKNKSRIFDHSVVIKEKKISVEEYIILKKSFLEGLMITKEWLQNIKNNNPEFNYRISKVLNNINLETVEYELRLLDTLRTQETEELFKFLDSYNVVRPSVVKKTPLTGPSKPFNLNSSTPIARPDIVSKEDLKNEINVLYQQEENFDICLNKTSELLQHPDLTEEEKKRYTVFYHELIEWINLKNKKIEDEENKNEIELKKPESAVNVTESRGTSISQLRTSMLKELQKLRQLYIDPTDK
jgi:hypothetical protein